MAEEVTLLRSRKEAYGGTERRVLYWYTISPRITDAATNEIAPQRRAELPEDALLYLTEQDKVAIDDGDAGFEVVNRPQTAGEGVAAYRARLLADHNARQTWWVQDQRDRYSASGTGATG